jgi:hypothetical protein
MPAQMSPIQMGLQDAHPYVRRTAVMGVLKVYHLDPAAVRNAGARSLPKAALLQGSVHLFQDLSIQRESCPCAGACMHACVWVGRVRPMLRASRHAREG